jgi:hypothetical protein
MRIAIIALLSVSAGLALLAFQSHKEIETERSRTEALQLEMNSLRKQLDEQKARTAAMFTEEAEQFDEEQTASAQMEVERPSAPGIAGASSPTQSQRVTRGPNRNRFDDPAVRSLELARHQQQLRRRNLGLADELGLSAEQETALIDLLANQVLEKQMLDMRQGRADSEEERRAQRAEREALQRDHEQQLQAQLGYNDYERYRGFQQQVPERQLLGQLRSRLDESSVLKDQQAKRLASAMFEERQLYMQQVRATEGFGGIAPNYPFVALPRGDPAVRVRFAEEQLVRTEAFLQRLRQRAEPILNEEQMRRFMEIQEEQLIQAQQLLERTKRRGRR